MADQVRNTDIFDKALFETEIEKAKALLVVLDKLEQGFKDVAVAQQEIVNKEDNKTIQSVQRTQKAVEKLTDVERQAIKIQKQKQSLADRIAIAQSKEGKQLEQTRQQILALNKANRQQAKENAGLLSTYDKLVIRQKKARQEVKQLAAQYGATNKRVLAAQKRFQKLGIGGSYVFVGKSVGRLIGLALPCFAA